MEDLSILEPQKYLIRLEIDVNHTEFQGYVELELNLKKETDQIILHADDLQIKNLSYRIGEEEKECKFSLNTEKKYMDITFPEKISGKLLLKANYTGKFHSDLLGMYRSSYEYQGQKNYVVVTQFEEIFARRAFPCIDHPSKKATFTIKFIIDEDLIGISNMPIKESKSMNSGKKHLLFEQTPKMCTYLLFFGVGMFEILEKRSEKQHVRLMTTPGKTQYGKLGLEMALKSLQFLEEYTSIEYPIDKCDVIAVPDFQFGAMENWGAILFRETLLLIYPDKTSQMGVFNVGSVVAHEVSHFWFGNLVSPSDWKYIWLNESFASYFTYAIPDKVYPEWQSWEHFITQYYISSLERDCLINTFPVELLDDAEVFITPAKVGIIYNKGAAVLRMLVNYLGIDTFQKGIEHFMKKYQYDIANSQQYWEAFEEATQKPVKEFEDSWMHQPGYPLITVQRKDNELLLSQERFTILPNDSEEKWLIPVTIEAFKGDGDSEAISSSFNAKTITMTLPPQTKIFKLNTGQTGFYRVKYSKDLLEKLGTLIKAKQLSPIDRFGIENDLFALTQRGDFTIDYYLDFIESHYLEEEEYLPLASLFPNLMQIHTLIDEVNPKIIELGLSLTDHFFSKYGYELKPDDSMTLAILKNFLLWMAYLLGSEEAKDFALDQFNKLKRGVTISPDLLSSVYKIALNEDEEAKKYLLDKLNISETPQVELRYIYDAFGSIKEESSITEYLDLTLEKVPPQTWFAVFYRMGHNKSALPYLWPWFKENIGKIEEQNPFVLGRAIAAFFPMGGLPYLEEVREYLDDYKENNEFQKDTIEMALEQLEINQHFKNQY